MDNLSSKNKRIAKNAMFLYIRMFFSMAVSLYTSRVVLSALGVLDYGIWNVVAGVIAMFSFLNSSMTGATSRFITYELGKGDRQRLQSVFSSALTIHLCIAVLILILGETFGLWFLQNKLVIPEKRMFAANIVYQFTILSTMASILQVPFNASIMAHEDMDVYAYVEIGNTVLRLGIVLLLMIIPFDKLITYGGLSIFVSILIISIYVVYCLRRYKGCCLALSADWKTLRPMLSFSGWDLYGNASVMARTQGVNMLLNMFFTATLNAASGIATQVQGAIMSFAGNVLQAFRPQVIRSYAEGNSQRMTNLICKASQYTTLLLLLFTIPLCVEIDYVLGLWLGNVPPYAAILCQYTLVFNVFANLSSCVISGIHATGKIKRPSVINGTLYLTVIPVTYAAYTNGYEPQVAFAFNVCAVILGVLSNIYTLRLYVSEFGVRTYFVDVLTKCSIAATISIIACYELTQIMDVCFGRLIAITLSNGLILIAYTYFIIMDDHDRSVIISKIKSLL